MEKPFTESTLRRHQRSPSLPERASRKRRTGWDSRSWISRLWLIAGTVAIVIIVVGAVAGGILGARANTYPNYYKIAYKLQDTFAGDRFFNDFDYFTGYDPTHGFVHYVDAGGAVAQNLTLVSTDVPGNSLATDGTAILRVDTSEPNATTGRRSVRVSSKKTYSSGLFIFDVIHSPYGCATWPALWLADLETWPSGGEIDVMETVNLGDTGNHMTLHTTSGCKMGKKRRREQTGRTLSNDCHNATNNNEGCGVLGPANTYGSTFNARGGGVYALEVRPEGIRIWMFERDNIPLDIWSKAPDPSQWGTALADFPNLECDIGAHFRDMRIVMNIDLCGDWAGQPSVFGANPTCAGSCSDWVAGQPKSFEQAYWELGGIWVYD